MIKNKFINKLFVFLAIAIGIAACSRKTTDYKAFLEGTEIVYSGTPNNIQSSSGKYRVQLSWQPTTDQSIKDYVIYWNNNADSLIVPASTRNPRDTIKVTIDKLDEYIYTFFIISRDSIGNKSIKKELTARSYGNIYQTNLQNRPINKDTPYLFSNDLSLRIKFLTPDTVNVKTIVRYINTSNVIVEKSVIPDSSSLLIKDYKLGSKIAYQSYYKPNKTAIDTFPTLVFDTFPSIIANIECDKTKFASVTLPATIGIQPGYGNSFSKLWDGNRTSREYPNIFNSDGALTLPSFFIIDLGVTYNKLSQLEEIGRVANHNPLKFEIWGIKDITNAIPTLPGNNANWKTHIISKGWTLFADVTRTDKGVTPLMVPFTNQVPARYIMMRVLTNFTGSKEINMSQLTFWNLYE